jgi:hypothetical protein
MNRDAAQATGNFLLFLNADTRMPEKFENLILNSFKPPKIVADAFELRSITICRAFALSSALQTGVPDI